MRAFPEFNSAASATTVQAGEQARLQSAATWAYLLLRPGMEFVRQRSNFILGWQAAAAQGTSLGEGASAGAVGSAGVPPLGSWMNLPDLTSPATRTVLPSNDAIYGAAHLELDVMGPVVVSIPKALAPTYFSVAVMDAHLNNVAHLGPRWTGLEASDHVIVPPGWAGEIPSGMGLIHAPTVSVCLYNRVLVGFESDALEQARVWREGIRLTPLAKWGTDDTIPDDVPLEGFLHPEINTLTDAATYLRIGAAHLRRNPMVEAAGWMAALVEDVAMNVLQEGAPANDACEVGCSEATTIIDSILTSWPRTNGWMLPQPDLGLPNPRVAVSAAFQQFQIGSNSVSESAYWFNDTDAADAPLDASGDAWFSLRFSAEQLPQHHSSGYWSLTMYDENSFLVANPLNRYATRIDHPGFVRDADGGATIVMSATLPPGVDEANWLPAPPGRFRLGLRVYYPTDALISGTWAPPPVLRRST